MPLRLLLKKVSTARSKPARKNRRCADLFKKNRDRIDGIIVNAAEFRRRAGYCRHAPPALTSGVPGPFSGHAPMHPTHHHPAFRRDSFCGKMSACNNLRQYGIPYSITTLHTESPDSPEFAKNSSATEPFRTRRSARTSRSSTTSSSSTATECASPPGCPQAAPARSRSSSQRRKLRSRWPLFLRWPAFSTRRCLDPGWLVPDAAPVAWAGCAPEQHASALRYATRSLSPWRSRRNRVAGSSSSLSSGPGVCGARPGARLLEGSGSR